MKNFSQIALLCLTGSALLAQENTRMDLGQLQTGATVSFTRDAGGEWGIAIAGGTAPRVVQAQPARLEVYRADDDIQQFAAGYKSVEKTADGMDARAEIAWSNVVFHVLDHWSVTGAGVSVSRKADVTGNAAGGFDSSVVLTVDPSVNWTNVNFLIPGALYGDPTYDGAGSAGGTMNYAARRFVLREDILSAPMFGISFSNGASVSLLDPAPRGDTTEAETRLTQPVITDARLQFGALAVSQTNNGPIVFEFHLSRNERFHGRFPRSGRGSGRSSRTEGESSLSPDRAGFFPELPSEFSFRAK